MRCQSILQGRIIARLCIFQATAQPAQPQCCKARWNLFCCFLSFHPWDRRSEGLYTDAGSLYPAASDELSMIW